MNNHDHTNSQINNDTFKETLSNALVYQGEDLLSLSEKQPVMLVFLRHFGCTFCREVLRDLGKIRSYIEDNQNTKMVFVHMSPPDYANKMLKKFKLEGAAHINDPEKKLYQAFGLKRGTFKQLFGLKMWIRGFQAGIMEGLLVGRERGDGFQMPGYFLLKDGEIVHEYVSEDAADHPDFGQLVMG